MIRAKYLLVNKVTGSILITACILLALIFTATSAGQAVTTSFPSLPDSGTLGSTYTFNVKIDVENVDKLPIQSVDLQIYNVSDPSTYTVNCTDLPIPSAANSSSSKAYSSAAGSVNIAGLSGAGWAYATASRYGYGYGYQSGTYATKNLGSGYGYGYGYNTDR